jgi:hypothetical protein
MKPYSSKKSYVDSFYVCRNKRYKVLATGLTKYDAELIARALNKLAEEESRTMSFIRYVKDHGYVKD